MFLASDLSYYIISLGCSKNLVDSELLNGQLLSCGFFLAESGEEADLIFINTCGFVTSAKEESISVILDALSVKNDNSNHIRKFLENGRLDERVFRSKVIVVGCLSERYFNEINKEIPEIDFLYGIPDHQLPKLIATQFNISIKDTVTTIKKPLINGLPYRYIKISDGCSNNCSYCAIPMIRGPIRNFDVKDIVSDSTAATGQGALELIIVAQDICSYNQNGNRLVDVVEKVSNIQDVKWIRLLYMHPDHITPEIISLFRDHKKVVPYIDIPFQHVNYDILKSMGRSGSPEKYTALINELRSTNPDIRVRSTFMVGYPGEGEREFDQLVAFLEEMKLDKVGVFMFSPEEGTPAAELENTIAEPVKKDRYDVLMKKQRDISLKNLSALIDSTVDVIIEEKIDDKTFIGRSCYDAPDVDGIFYLTGERLPVNTIVKAKVTDTTEYDLIGEYLCYTE